MSLHPVCIFYSQDTALTGRARNYLGHLVRVQVAERPAALLTACGQYAPALVLIDMCAQDSRELLPQLVRDYPALLVIVVAPSGLETHGELERLGVWTVIEPDTARAAFQTLVRQAVRHIDIMEENRMLKENTIRQADPSPVAAPRRDSPAVPSSIFHFSRAFRQFDNMASMLDTLVEGVAATAKVSRVGLFAATRGSQLYRLRAGLKCLEGTQDLEFSDDDRLLCWMRLNPQLISRSGLMHVTDPSVAGVLKQTLDMLGAEAMLPLFADGDIVGWIFFGRRITGLPFSESDLEGLVELAEHVAVILENGLLYEELGVQKTLGDTLLQSVPDGIVAIDEEGTIRWFNDSAGRILDLRPEAVMQKPASAAGGTLSGLLLQTLRGRAIERREWTSTATERECVLQTRQLTDREQCRGAVLIMHDVTDERVLRGKEEKLERATFWTELAAAISHEVRNPLVAISTFSQLLPERYDDPEFRDKFSVLASSEISRVNRLLDQINAFANPPQLAFKPLKIEDVLREALEVARSRSNFKGAAVRINTDPALPALSGDRASLIDCFAHLITNAIEACADGEKIHILVDAVQSGGNNGNRTITVTVTDNGKGIPLEISDKVYSPFCSLKARGIGLGLPIAKRTVSDHDGKVSIETSSKGTSVAVELPLASKYTAEPVLT